MRNASSTVESVPSSPEAEKAVIGCGLWDSTKVDELHWLRPHDFWNKAHQEIWDVMQWLRLQNLSADLMTVTARLGELGKLEYCGGVDYLNSLLREAFAPSNAEYHARIVKDHSMRRQAISICSDGCSSLNGGRTANGDPRGVIDEIDAIQQRLFEVAVHNGRVDATPVSESARAEYERLAALVEVRREGVAGLSGLSSGYRDLDELLGGLHRGDLVVVAARTAQGKTTLLCNMALRQAQAGTRVGFFSAEMSKQQITQKCLAALSGVSTSRMRTSNLDSYELVLLGKAADGLNVLPLWIDDTSALHVGDLRARARRMVSADGVQVVMVDYLQRLRSRDSSRRYESRQQEVSEIVQGLKTAARDLCVPFVAACQLSREIDKRDDHRPRLSDLRDSGAIEQEADVVVFLYHNGDGTTVIVAKQRMGGEGEVPLRWKRDCCRFEDIILPIGGNGRRARHADRAYAAEGAL